jgi:hypothetical protein
MNLEKQTRFARKEKGKSILAATCNRSIDSQ